MLKLGRVTKIKVLFLVLVFVFNFDLFKFSAAILEKGLLGENHVSSVIKLQVLDLLSFNSTSKFYNRRVAYRFTILLVRN